MKARATHMMISLLVVALAMGCEKKNEPDPEDAAADPDATEDPVEEEVVEDVPDDLDEEEVEQLCPPGCPTAPSDSAVVGQPCISLTDCGAGYECFSESIEVFDADGDTVSDDYVSWRGGACTLTGSGTAGCDLDDPDTCPPGSACIYLFENDMGVEFHGCVDACSSKDTSRNPYGWNCGCRAGYSCDIDQEVCLPGCSNDVECCELWDDANENGTRDDGEVLVSTDCNAWCDGNSDDEFPGEDCMASFACVNDGNADATCLSECTFDSDCPADYRCLDEVRYVDDAGEPYYPGGWCVKSGCDLVGRGGTEQCGCVNLGTGSDPMYWALGTCDTTIAPGEEGFVCRDGWACMPHPTSAWYAPSTVGHDGICLPAEHCEPTGLGLGESCTADTECASAGCLGGCYSFSGAPRLCAVQCNEPLAEGGICGAAETAGEEAPGVCWSGLCLAACHSPDGNVATNDCPQPMACLNNGPLAYGSVSSHNEGDSAPPGFCFTACLDNAWCSDVFGTALNCNTLTGQCGV